MTDITKNNNGGEDIDSLLESVDFSIFGIELKPGNKKKKDAPVEPESILLPSPDDGAFVSIASGTHQLSYQQDISGADAVTDIARIKRYREIAQYPECEQGISEITNEAIVADDDYDPVEISLDSTKISEKVKKAIREEFDHILSLLNFNIDGHDLFRDWYIDGRLVFTIITDEKNSTIVELRQIDPCNIRKIKEVDERIDPKTRLKVYKEVEDYYIYEDKSSGKNQGRGYGTLNNLSDRIKLHKDSIVFVPSGLLDEERTNVISYLHKSLKSVNQLRMLEDAQVIYRLVRAPERRIFYIDVGNLPTGKAEAYLQSVISKFRNKIVYDGVTGEIKDARQQTAMVEDFWLPRRSDGRSTEITTLPGQTNSGAQEDLEYFQKKLFRSLGVPLQRLTQETGFSIGRGSEITREEVKFSKFISRLRNKFSDLFYQTLKTQLILKGVIKESEWYDLVPEIKINYLRDNYFTELKEAELIRERIATLEQIDNYVGKYFSIAWVRKNILRQTEDDIKEIDKDIKKEGVDTAGDANGDTEDSGMGGYEEEPEQPKATQPPPEEKKKDGTEVDTKNEKEPPD